MPEATATTPAAPAASPATSGSAPSSSAPAASMATPSQATPQTTGGKQNQMAAAEAAMAGKGPKGVAEAMRATPTPPAAEQAPSNPQTPAAAETQYEGSEADNYGLNPAQVQALKRAQQWNPDVLKRMPPNTRKSVADFWDKTVREQDRQHSLSRQNPKPGEAQPAGKPAEGQPGETAGTPQEGQQEGQPSQASQPFAFTEQGFTQFAMKATEPDAKESKLLVDQFGEDGFKAMRAREQRNAAAMSKLLMQAVSPALQAGQQALQHVWDMQFSAGVAKLRTQPGYENIEASPENMQALRTGAAEFARSSGNPNLTIEQAVMGAAPKVFNIDPRLAAQVETTRVAAPMLNTSGARPSPVNSTPRPQTREQRIAAAAAAAQAGKGRQAVSEAYSA